MKSATTSTAASNSGQTVLPSTAASQPAISEHNDSASSTAHTGAVTSSTTGTPTTPPNIGASPDAPVHALDSKNVISSTPSAANAAAFAAFEALATKVFNHASFSELIIEKLLGQAKQRAHNRTRVRLQTNIEELNNKLKTVSKPDVIQTEIALKETELKTHEFEFEHLKRIVTPANVLATYLHFMCHDVPGITAFFPIEQDDKSTIIEYTHKNIMKFGLAMKHFFVNVFKTDQIYSTTAKEILDKTDFSASKQSSYRKFEGHNKIFLDTIYNKDTDAVLLLCPPSSLEDRNDEIIASNDSKSNEIKAGNDSKKADDANDKRFKTPRGKILENLVNHFLQENSSELRTLYLFIGHDDDITQDKDTAKTLARGKTNTLLAETKPFEGNSRVKILTDYDVWSMPSYKIAIDYLSKKFTSYLDITNKKTVTARELANIQNCTNKPDDLELLIRAIFCDTRDHFEKVAKKLAAMQMNAIMAKEAAKKDNPKPKQPHTSLQVDVSSAAAIIPNPHKDSYSAPVSFGASPTGPLTTVRPHSTGSMGSNDTSTMFTVTPFHTTPSVSTATSISTSATNSPALTAMPSTSSNVPPIDNKGHKTVSAPVTPTAPNPMSTPNIVKQLSAGSTPITPVSASNTALKPPVYRKVPDDDRKRRAEKKVFLLVKDIYKEAQAGVHSEEDLNDIKEFTLFLLGPTKTNTQQSVSTPTTVTVVNEQQSTPAYFDVTRPVPPAANNQSITPTVQQQVPPVTNSQSTTPTPGI
ncbi:hypothetical protein AYO45_00195 [Gammaproteobacteria bacterium SCGC AG-212-F23]|nr:hypothetical protein AYO45_00195 [Gammaproteobacteria bacterium SCGC AG-212-F23]